MKSFTQTAKNVCIYTVLLLSVFRSYSQPVADYVFVSPTLVSGTDLTVGAVYRFSLVKPGVDALVTITGAANATLTILDQTGTGYNNAFQPNVRVNSMTTGYIDFRIDFVVTGTSTLSTQTEVPITALDIDGYNSAPNQRLNEFEEFDLGPGAFAEFDFTGSDINVAFISATTIRATNVAGVEYGSINLSPNVRFTAVNGSITTIFVRSGAINNDVFNNVNRQRSFYFARFSYPNSGILAAAGLKSFTGSMAQQQATLHWELEKGHAIKKLEIERMEGKGSFNSIATIEQPVADHSSFTDYEVPAGTHYYRLKLQDASGAVHYSKIIMLEALLPAQNNRRLLPTVCTHKTTLQWYALQRSPAHLQVVDYSGRVVLTRQVTVNKGANFIEIPLAQQWPAGNYAVYLLTGQERWAGKLIKVDR
ncbi:hypothetical protein HB364_05235 [Pseudoflavitalea sp. X16]|uniref:hypothetical protein n=1 Tax=Paraflavitalea devenefica TaxID=2716334 RepID=UPI001422D666|nr:hypothetical protein [Paraflavitalea devenefica]NII24469.1 hypothetical protein [Paraflavitalea devenefica]